MYANNGNTKKVSLCMAGQGRVLEIEVDPSTSMGETIQRAGMNPSDFDIAAPAGNRLVSLDEKPWDLVQRPTDSLLLTPTAQVG